MKYVCLYVDEKKWESMSEGAHAVMDDRLAYDHALRQSGHLVGGEAFRRARAATTPRYRSGKASVTDGPYAETKE
jgi:hypothetical protein